MTWLNASCTPSQLTATDINHITVRPLVRKYERIDNLATVYACFVVRSRFLAQAAKSLAHANTMMTRADLCELLAIKLMRQHHEEDRRGFALATALTTSWRPTAGAPSEVVAEVQDAVGGNEEDLEDPNSALEVCLV